MYQVKVNDGITLSVANTEAGLSVDGQPLSWDVKALPNGTFSILANDKSYVAIPEKFDRDAKTVTIRINHNLYSLHIAEPIDQLLEKMGLNMAAQKKAESIKAPMPGLVLKVLVSEGQELKKGTPVLILEAMKMENVFKAPEDAIVKTIKIKEGQAVEKGALLIELA